MQVEVVSPLHVVAVQFKRVDKLTLSFFAKDFNSQSELSVEIADELINELRQSHLLRCNDLQVHSTFEAETASLRIARSLPKSRHEETEREGTQPVDSIVMSTLLLDGFFPLFFLLCLFFVELDQIFVFLGL